MRAGFIGFFASFFALPMGYVPFKYLYLQNNATITTSEGQKYADHKLDERKVNLGTQEFKEWVETIVEDAETTVEKNSNNVNYQALIAFGATYLFLKLFSKIVRFITVATLITLSLWKMVKILHTNQLSLILSDERYLQFCSFANYIEVVWNYHKPYIGDYIERLIHLFIDAKITQFVMSSVLGILTFFIFG